MQITTTFQTAGPFNLGGGEILVIAIFFLFFSLFWLVPRIARAFGEGLGRGIEKGRQDAKRADDQK